MNWNELYNVQKVLDTEIEKKRKIQQDLYIQEVYLALLVEIGELANEIRAFKYWSDKPKSPKEVILEEYTDCLHFLLSIGNLHFYNYQEKVINLDEIYLQDINVTFLQLYQEVIHFRQNPSYQQYILVFEYFMYIGKVLGFSEEDIYNAYMEKNEKNHKRQKEGY